MGKVFRVGIIGLGVIGRRMLDNMPAQGRLVVAAGWDSDKTVCEMAQKEYPWLSLAASAEAMISDPAIDLIYIGVPPRAHGLYARAAIKAGKAVFCEKPLGVDLADSAALVAFAAEHSARQAINLSLAAARGVQHMRKAIANNDMGRISGAEIRLHFSQWPRGWQANATWLARREEGGFVREVATHFLYLAETLLGSGRLVSSGVRYPDEAGAAEILALAELECEGVPVTLAGTVGGAGPDLIEFTVWGDKISFRLTDFYRLWSTQGGEWQQVFPAIENLARDAYMLQLDELVLMLEGKSHVLPGFQAAFDVQAHVEAILAER
ncbi:Gfo/Idh/MocA family protein [Roseovarius sp.]|uniref:Gfo/Idh/MocA family protein n=1 Tax=Roseovarius sp. TaxID=1486281 RepID=UPI003A97EF94